MNGGKKHRCELLMIMALYVGLRRVFEPGQVNQGNQVFMSLFFVHLDELTGEGVEFGITHWGDMG